MPETFGSDDPRDLTPEEALSMASDWSDYRSNYGASGSHDRMTFEAGWKVRNESAHRAADAAEVQLPATLVAPGGWSVPSDMAYQIINDRPVTRTKRDALLDRLEELAEQIDKLTEEAAAVASEFSWMEIENRRENHG